MNHKKARLFITGLIAVLSISLFVPQVLAGEPAPDPDAYEIVGPTMWAVGVLDCTGDTPQFATIRVKKVEDDCVVETDHVSAADAAAGGFTFCPGLPQDVLYYTLPESIFGLGCDPIITKVKNFKNEGGIVSFDAQIKCLVPKSP